LTQKWSKRFQIKAGRWVFVPTAESKKTGALVKRAVERKWSPPNFYFHLKAGGHVGAVQSHLDDLYFFRADIDNFFGRVNRSRLTRCLHRWYKYIEARGLASESVVKFPDSGEFALPYGFVQSPILASLALDKSKLGSFLRGLARQGDVKVSLYVDDIILSSKDEARLREAADEMISVAEKALLPINKSKIEGPASCVTAFNIELSHGVMRITQARLEQLRASYQTSTSEYTRNGIKSYINTVNKDQWVGFE
jgi:peptidoglycan hydrolase-like protein with peptidoglycan-binding domain